MHRYQVRFYYGTDLRTQQTVTAYSDLQALAAALQVEGIADWNVDPAMRIEIQRA
jgi:ABC-type branched-subunit amino acid transport system substrate-binding protein